MTTHTDPLPPLDTTGPVPQAQQIGRQALSWEASSGTLTLKVHGAAGTGGQVTLNHHDTERLYHALNSAQTLRVDTFTFQPDQTLTFTPEGAEAFSVSRWPGLRRILLHALRRHEIWQSSTPEMWDSRAKTTVGNHLVGWVEADSLENAFERSQHGVPVGDEQDPRDEVGEWRHLPEGAPLMPDSWYLRDGSGAVPGERITSACVSNVFVDPHGKRWWVMGTSFEEVSE